ncbi:hypothetical protein EON79_21000, partial [bacterium]
MSETTLDASTALLDQFATREYPHGWSTDIESDTFEIGLSEDVVRRISAKKEEPQWLLDWRLKAYRHLLTMKEPAWPNVGYQPVDLQSIAYYSAPKMKPRLNSLDEADPELLRTFQKLGIPVSEQRVLLNVQGAGETHGGQPLSAGEGVTPEMAAEERPIEGTNNIAVDAVFDSASVVTTFKAKLKEKGVLFMSIQEAVREHG